MKQPPDVIGYDHLICGGFCQKSDNYYYIMHTLTTHIDSMLTNDCFKSGSSIHINFREIYCIYSVSQYTESQCTHWNGTVHVLIGMGPGFIQSSYSDHIMSLQISSNMQ